jgi:hypothetical protein
MKLTVVRAIPPVLAVAIAMLFLSGVPRFKNAKHGLDFVVGEVAWLGFLVAALSLLVLVAVAVARRKSLRGFAALCICAVAATAASAAQSAPTAQQTLSLQLDGKHLSVGTTTWRPGAVHIAATSTRGEQELSLLRFRPGYSYARLLADGRQANGRGRAAHAALGRIMAGTEFIGGVDVFPGEHASFAAVVRPGTYYLGELNDRPLFRAIHVRGAATEALPTTAAVLDEFEFGYRIKGTTLPAHGTITIRNVGRQPHRLNLEPVEAGTTRAQVGAYIRKTGGRPYAPPPSFARRGPELGTSLLGPGETIQFGYSVPAGTYALIGWQQDSTTGKPQALEGMYDVVRFR